MNVVQFSELKAGECFIINPEYGLSDVWEKIDPEAEGQVSSRFCLTLDTNLYLKDGKFNALTFCFKSGGKFDGDTQVVRVRV